jgi:hypothetical protein
MSAVDEWWHDEDASSIPAASDCVVKRIDPETGEIATVGIIPALKGNDLPGTTLRGLTSERHANTTPHGSSELGG